ncbi:glycosyltransferase family 32 protein [Collinsella ihumii]|uniref:Glycosyltransferase n=1 Tax=Collinsella ihumii TaxID=1720204 RepID=A0ABT7XH44_9ACTN|nr:glycosyltransferase [Collinsella ihumii]MDN0064730.1 glycosyltransferase [Collinsella ihumii]
MTSLQNLNGTRQNMAEDESLQEVPKIIHYCWFGGGELSKSAKKTLASWERFAPGFEIRRCDETTFDVTSCDWTRKAYDAKKYAFVADYARFKMIYDYGGVYMDLGSKLIRDITSLVEDYSPLSAIEELSRMVAPGLILVARPHDPVVASVLSRYEVMSFIDDPEYLIRNTVNDVFVAELEKLGYSHKDEWQTVGDWTLLPSSAFNPVYGIGGYHIKRDTYSIHQSSGSWTEPELRVKQKIVRLLAPFLGRRIAQIIGRTIGEIKVKGIRNGAISLFNVTRDVMTREQR